MQSRVITEFKDMTFHIPSTDVDIMRARVSFSNKSKADQNFIAFYVQILLEDLENNTKQAALLEGLLTEGQCVDVRSKAAAIIGEGWATEMYLPDEHADAVMLNDYIIEMPRVFGDFKAWIGLLAILRNAGKDASHLARGIFFAWNQGYFDDKQLKRAVLDCLASNAEEADNLAQVLFLFSHALKGSIDKALLSRITQKKSQVRKMAAYLQNPKSVDKLFVLVEGKVKILSRDRILNLLDKADNIKNIIKTLITLYKCNPDNPILCAGAVDAIIQKGNQRNFINFVRQAAEYHLEEKIVLTPILMTRILSSDTDPGVKYDDAALLALIAKSAKSTEFVSLKVSLLSTGTSPLKSEELNTLLRSQNGSALPDPESIVKVSGKELVSLVDNKVVTASAGPVNPNSTSTLFNKLNSNAPISKVEQKPEVDSKPPEITRK